MGKKTQPYKLGLPQKYTAGAKNKARQAKVIKRGQAAYKKGQRLPDSYFKERTAIGGASLDDEDEKEPGAISGSTTAGNVLEDMRTQISLDDKGEAGTGTVTVPKGTPTQQRKYAAAVFRRKNPDFAEKLDAQKRELQKSFSFGSPRTNLSMSNQSEESDGKAAFRKFFEDADKRDPVSDDDPLPREDIIQNELMESQDDLQTKTEEIGSEDVNSEEFRKLMEERKEAARDIVRQTIEADEDRKSEDGGERSAIDEDTEAILNTNAEIYGPFIPGAENMSADELRAAGQSAARENYYKYHQSEPIEESSVEVNGKPYTRQVHNDGAVFLRPDDYGQEGSENNVFREHDDPEQAAINKAREDEARKGAEEFSRMFEAYDRNKDK